MRAALVALLIVVTGVAAWLWMDNGDSPSPSPGPESPDVRSDDDSQPDATGVGGARAVPTRTDAIDAPTTGLADAPSACLRVVDHDHSRPIAGASVRRMQGGAMIGFTDANGLVAVPLKDPEQLAVVADGFLLRLAPTQLGSTEDAPQPVRMVRDRWSLVRRLEFRSAEGRRPGEVFVRFRPVENATVQLRGGPTDGDAVTSRAWREHTMLAVNPACADVAVQLGVFATDRVHRLGNGDAVRFTVPGRFVAECATVDGLAARPTVEISDGHGLMTVYIDLEPGRFVRGAVFGSVASTPLVGAKVTLQGSDPLGLVATTGVGGAFDFGPLPAGSVTLLVRHHEHEPIAHGPIDAAAADVRVTLQELPKSTIRGRVRRRPGLLPLERATVAWTAAQLPPLTARTDADGVFQIAARGEGSGRLAISSPGFVAYEELVEPGAAFADYDLLPIATAERVAGGMTAVLAGIVVDASGRPQAGVAVRWQPARRSAPAGVPGRRTLRGAALELALLATTQADGTFALETDQFGRGTLTVDDGGSLPTEAIAGATKDDHRLQR